MSVLILSHQQQLEAVAVAAAAAQPAVAAAAAAAARRLQRVVARARRLRVQRLVETAAVVGLAVSRK